MNKFAGRQACIAWALACAVATGCRTGSLPPVTTVPAVVPTPAAASASDADPTTLDGKLMFGYQGWFGCPGDGSPLGAWEHWFRRGAPSVASLRVDMWPDVSELSGTERCETPLVLPGGQSAQVFSAYNPRTVDQIGRASCRERV